jgi:tripartite-type tricarboxylate transporter receptor subunit TctC
MKSPLPNRRTLHRRSALAALLAMASGAARAGDRSETSDHDKAAGPLRIVVAYPPGGVSDAIARALAAELALRLGVPVQVENRPGAGGAIALRSLARAVPDGRQLVLSAITPLALDAQLRAGAAAGERGGSPLVVPVAGVMLTPSLLVGTPAFRGRSFADLLAIARERPGSLRWATSGIATTGHLVLEQVRAVGGIAVTHVPYKGGGQQLSDALAGQFELLSTNVGALQLRYVRSGRFKALAVGAPQRVPPLPDVPTLAELGLPQANLASRFGLFAPGGTPLARLRQLNAAVDTALRQPAIRGALLESGSLPMGGSVEAFADEIARSNAEITRAWPPASRVPAN